MGYHLAKKYSTANTMLSLNQIAGVFDLDYFWKGTINIVEFLIRVTKEW